MMRSLSVSCGLVCLVGAAACTGTIGSSESGSGGHGAHTSQGGGGSGAAGMGGSGAAGMGGSGAVGGGGSGGGVTSSGGSGGAPSDDPCAGAADGSICGTDLGGLSDHNSVYTCAGGITADVSACDNGCANGACIAPPSDPCETANAGDGAYCGASLGAGDPDTLYQCQGQMSVSEMPCSAGCQVQPPGTPDNCKPAGDPCLFATSGNGAYCGGSLTEGGVAKGDLNVLYSCVGMATQSQTVCPNGCQIMPPGVADACAPPAGGCCLNKPPGALTQSYTACGSGGSHYGIDYGTPIGTPIYAGMAGTVKAHALGFPNCYDGGCSSSCWNSFNYVRLQSDCGDPEHPGNDLHIYYLHIDDLAPGIANGTHVEQGQLLAYSGNSGCSSGPHIHIETVTVAPGGSPSLSTCKSENPADRYCP